MVVVIEWVINVDVSKLDFKKQYSVNFCWTNLFGVVFSGSFIEAFFNYELIVSVVVLKIPHVLKIYSETRWW